MWFLRLFVLPHTIAGIFLLTLLPARLYSHYCGASVIATIDSVEARSSKKRDYYWITFHYFLEGVRYHDSESRDAPPAVGDTFSGRAAAFLGRPELYPLTLDWRDVLPLAFAPLFWNGILSIFLYIAWVKPIRQQLLVRSGEATAGTVVGKRTRQSKGTHYIVAYQFRVGQRNCKAEFEISQAAYESVNLGMPVTVVFDPARPKRSLPYELSDFVVATPGQPN